MHRPRSRNRIAGVVLALMCGVGGPAVGQESFSFDRSARQQLETLAKEVAKCGAKEETEIVLSAMGDLGLPEDELDALRTDCLRRADRVRTRKPLDRMVSKLDRALETCAGQLAGLPGERQPLAARALLRLDAECAPAREILGHTRRDGAWRDADQLQHDEHRRQIQAWIQRARYWDVEPEVDTVDDPFVAVVTGKRASRARWGSFVAISSVSEEELRTAMRRALRACALSHALRHQGAALPDRAWTGRRVPVMLRNAEQYGRCIDESEAHGIITTEQAQQARALGLLEVDGFEVNRSELRLASALFSHFGLDLVTVDAGWSTPNLVSGHLSWVSQAVLGEQIPYFVDLVEGEVKEGRTSSRYAMPVRNPESESWWMARIGEAGLYGSRAYMRWVVERGEDAPFPSTFVRNLVDLDSRMQLKSLFVCEFLQQQGQFAPLLRHLAKEPGPQSAERFLDRDLVGFEREWQRWLFGEPPSLRQRMTAVETKDEVGSDLLQKILGIRLEAYRGVYKERLPLFLDQDLSRGCVAHARYLSENPSELDKWPQVHQEFEHLEGYSVIGHHAAMNSLIAPGTRDVNESIDAFMSTFYHRVPLLRPGLVGVGYGHVDGIAVVDVGSLLVPELVVSMVAWPPPGVRGVPCSFSPELPHPVPGEDQSAWGYPITLQHESAASCVMKLRPKRPLADPIDCWLLTPTSFHNPELVPPNVCCLTPKQKLKDLTLYYVDVHFEDGAEIPPRLLEWSFTTGRN